MIKIHTREVDACDVAECGSTEYVRRCIQCGQVHCMSHQKKLGTMLRPGVFWEGYLEAYICSSCLANPDPAIKPILRAYFQIELLRQQYASWTAAFNQRKEEAEQQVKSFEQEILKRIQVKY